MRLLRFALAIFSHNPSIPPLRMEIGGVSISMKEGQSANNGEQTFLLTATANLEQLPEKDESNRIVVPQPVRERCEAAIASLCDIVATFYGCPRSVLSPIPCIALDCDSADERSYLEESRGILATQKRDSGVRAAIPLEIDLLKAVSDRLDGVALIAEAYSGGELGRYRDFARFFELAFRGEFTSLGKKLCQFLEPTPFSYSRAEINKWILLRDPLSHADMKKAQCFAVSNDVRRHILRVEQAALDVLFNKSVWGDRSKTRRQTWTPEAYTSSLDGHVIVKQGTKPHLLFRVYDEFGVFPRCLQARLNRGSESWSMRLNDDDVPRFSPNKDVISLVKDWKDGATEKVQPGKSETPSHPNSTS